MDCSKHGENKSANYIGHYLSIIFPPLQKRPLMSHTQRAFQNIKCVASTLNHQLIIALANQLIILA